MAGRGSVKWRFGMPAKKRNASSRSKLLNRAVKVGRSYLRQAERRLPPDVRKQIERSIKDGQKTVEGAIKQLRTRVDRTARQADLERALKSVPVRRAAPRRAAPRRRASASPVVTPPAVESPSMAITDPSPREPAG